MANELPYSSEVAFYKGVPFDKSYQHTIYFKNKNNQYIYFHSKLAYSFTNLSYQRINRNTIRVSRRFEDLNGCNYLSIKNGENDKTYYCFVDEVNYISDDVSEVTYTIDIMQTYLFDYNLGQCWVDRQHSNSDDAGDNIIDDYFVGEYVNNEKVISGVRYGETDIPLDAPATETFKVKDYDGDYDDEFVTLTNCKYAILIGITKNIFSGNREPLSECYDNVPAPFKLVAIPWSDFSIGPTNIDKEYNFYNLLNFNGSGPATNYDDIVFACVVPYKYIKKSKWNYFLHIEGGGGLPRYCVWFEVDSSSVYFGSGESLFKSFSLLSPNTLDGYTPKNKKLFTYPYNYIYITNLSGMNKEYRYEEMGGENAWEDCSFALTGYFDGNSLSFMLLPSKYDKENIPTDYGISAGQLPTVSWAENAFSTWVEQKDNQNSIAIMQSLAQIGLGVVSLPQGNAIGSLNKIVSGSSSLAEAINQRDVAKTLPNTVNGALNNNFNFARSFVGLKIFNKCIKEPYAKQIDDYFTMYGYAQKKTATPNRCTRKFWTYVKTKGCVIKPTGNGMTSQIQKRLADIYDNGITFWRYDGVDAPNPDVANYNQNNEILD